MTLGTAGSASGATPKVNTSEASKAITSVARGDAVLCPSFTFAATAEAVALVGATPVFVDIEADTFNMDPRALESAVATAREHGLRPVGVIHRSDRTLSIAAKKFIQLLEAK